MDKFTKITTGFITQSYEQVESGKYVCIHQEFIAGDEVQYENANGDSITPPMHDYQPFNMLLYSSSQNAESIREALNLLQMRGRFDAGIQVLKTLLKHLG